MITCNIELFGYEAQAYEELNACLENLYVNHQRLVQHKESAKQVNHKLYTFYNKHELVKVEMLSQWVMQSLGAL